MRISETHSFTPSHSLAESGQSIVELAFSLPLFLLLILGGAEIANLAWASVQVNNAARAGAAYGSISRGNAESSGNIQAAAQAEAPKITNLQVTSSPVCYCVTSGTPGSPDLGCTNTNLTNCVSPNVIQMAVQVNTTASVSTLVHYPGLPASYTVRAQATMGVEQ